MRKNNIYPFKFG